jgi:hypothetical protein
MLDVLSSLQARLQLDRWTKRSVKSLGDTEKVRCLWRSPLPVLTIKGEVKGSVVLGGPLPESYQREEAANWRFVMA